MGCSLIGPALWRGREMEGRREREMDERERERGEEEDEEWTELLSVDRAVVHAFVQIDG